ncbi:hypothetical protein DICA1_C09582 [Diutina catenulata]
MRLPVLLALLASINAYDINEQIACVESIEGVPVITNNYMTPSLCADHCKARTYTAVQGDECFCLDRMPTSKEGRCVTPCSGFGLLRCGGPSAYSIYQIGDEEDDTGDDSEAGKNALETSSPESDARRHGESDKQTEILKTNASSGGTVSSQQGQSDGTSETNSSPSDVSQASFTEPQTESSSENEGSTASKTESVESSAEVTSNQDSVSGAESTASSTTESSSKAESTASSTTESASKAESSVNSANTNSTAQESTTEAEKTQSASKSDNAGATVGVGAVVGLLVLVML